MRLTIHKTLVLLAFVTIRSLGQQTSLEFNELIRRSDSLIYDQPQQSLKFAEQALEVSGNDSLKAVALNRIGSSHWSIGSQLQALEKIQESLQISEVNDYESLTALNLGALGNVYAASDLDLDAIGYYRSELVVQQKMNNKLRLFLINNNIARAFLETRSYDSASNYLEKARIYLDEEVKHIHSIYYYNLADFEFRLGHLERSDSLITLSLENAIEYNSTRWIIHGNRLRAEVEKAKGEFDKAIVYGDYAFKLALNSGVKELIYKTSKTLAGCLGALGRYEEAHEKQQLYEAYLDSVQNTSTINELELLSYYQRLFQVRVLEEKNELNKQIAEQRKLIINGLVVVLIIAALLIAIIIFTGLKIRKQKKQLERLNTFKTKIFAIVSHDLKSPILSVSSVIDLFNQKLINKEDIEPVVPEVKEKTSNLVDLLNNVFQWAEGQMEGEQMKKEHFFAKPVFQSLEKELHDRLKEKNIDLKLEYKQDLMLFSNKGVIRILLRNLFVNAIKYSNKDSNVEVKAYANANSQILEVKDEGVGMSEEVKEGLFTGGLVSSEGTDGELGNGLGLALCHDFVKTLGGEIEVKSELGKGSIFRVILPVEQSSEQ